MDKNHNPPISLEDLDRAPPSLPTTPFGEGVDGSVEQRLDQTLKRLGEVSNAKTQAEDELRRERAKNTTRAILDELIRPFARKVFVFMCCYSAVVGCLVFYHGLHLGFSLPDGVLNYLVGSTAVTVLGLVGTVLTGIFIGARK